MAVTITEIAEVAGVSPGTVSRVLNGRYKENRPAIARRADTIRQIAAELGYRPNAAARSMSSGKFGMMAFVTCGDLGFDWFAPGLMHGIHRELAERGSRLILNELSAAQLSSKNSVPWLFRESAVDAVLLHLDAKIPGALAAFQESHPNRVVLVNDKADRDCVFPDEVAGGRFAARRLIEMGRRNIAFFRLHIHGETPHFSAVDRRAGFEFGLEEAGLNPVDHAELVPDFKHLKGNAIECAHAFLLAHGGVKGLDSVVCYGLPEAAAIDAAARSLGLRIPEDLAIVAFHDRPLHAITGIATDTVIVPFTPMGAAAVSMAVDLVEGEAGSLPARRVPYTEFFDASIRRVVSIDTSEF